MARRVIAMLLVTVAVIMAGLLYFAYVVRTGLVRELSLWADQRRQEGWTVEARLAPPASTLFAPGIELRGAELDGAGDLLPGGFRLAADRVELRADLMQPKILHVTIGGNVTVRLGPLPAVTFVDDHLTGTVTLGNHGKIEAIAIDGKNLRSADLGGMSVGTLQALLTLDASGAAADVRTEALVVPVNPYGLGQHLSDVTLNAALVGWPPGAGSRGARADVWRASGGRIDISRLVVGWGPLGLVGEARLGLDQALQPDGTAKLQVRGYQAVLDGLGDNGALVAAVIAATTPGDEADFDIRIKKSAVNVDRIRVVKIPRIDW